MPKLILVAVACSLVFDARPEAEDLENLCGRAAKDEDDKDDHDENGRAQRLGSVALEPGSERYADGAT